MTDCIALGIDIGGTNIKAGLVSGTGELLEHAVATTPQQRTPEDVVAVVSRTVSGLLAKRPERPGGVGIAAAGPVDLQNELVLAAPNFPGWKSVPLRRKLEAALKLPCALGNDVNAFGLAEHRWGAAQGLRHFIAVAVGTGVGGAVFINGELYRGARGGAGELGFTVINANGPEVLGCPGVIEGFIGRRGFDDIVLRLFPTGEVPTPRRITDLAAAGDERARLVHSEMAGYLAEAAASWIHTLNPQALVLGGGTLSGAHYFLAEFERKLNARALHTHCAGLQILPGKLGYYAGVQGAAALWFAARNSLAHGK